jgi:hypothetical protein
VQVRHGEPPALALVEGIDVRDTGRSAEVIFATKVEGQLATVNQQVELRAGQRFGDSFRTISESLGFGRTAPPVQLIRGHEQR